jgi:hypothetical protein
MDFVHARTRPVSAHCPPGFGRENGQNPAGGVDTVREANLMPEYAGETLQGSGVPDQSVPRVAALFGSPLVVRDISLILLTECEI